MSNHNGNGRPDPSAGTEEPLSEKAAEQIALPEELPVLPLREMVLYPQVVLPLVVTSERAKRLVNDVALRDRLLAVAAQKKAEVEQPRPADLYRVGCAVKVLRIMKFPDDSVRMLVQGLARIGLNRFTQTDPYLVVRAERLESHYEDSLECQATARSVVDQFQTMVSLSQHLPEELKIAVMNIEDFGRLADMVASALNLSIKERQSVLEALDVAERLRKLNGFLSRELQMLELSTKIQSQVKGELEKTQRDYLLRQQIRALQEELGEGDERSVEIKELRGKLKKIKLPDEARQEAERELDRLARMPPAAAEYTVARTYLDWIMALPWNKSTRDRLDIKAAEKVLDEDHYDLTKIKQRIIEYLAVRKLKKDTKGPILCFVGPPGTGKTSLGRSIARTMGRKFVRISLGGVRDEAEIRGHRRTYVGALPGRIIQGLRKAGSDNPVFMLDEIDKVGADFRGDPAAALLEVLDPEQNCSFSDHYLDVPFDLSKVMFITTANVLDTVPPALRDRMETLELAGYTDEEKLSIARQFLIPRQLEAHGLTTGNLTICDDAILALIRDYTREAGLRNLEREIANICRKVAADVARSGRRRRGARKVTRKDVAELIGPEKFYPEAAERTADPGVATGLAWTQAGGAILFVESSRMPGTGRLVLTGSLGDVMKESAQAALTYVRSRASAFGLRPDGFKGQDVHIHVPAGAIPKDGPSAGVTIAMSLVSLYTGAPVRPNVAMTGEITLRGRVLPVGGIKEKVLAAHRAGIKTVIMPKQNKKDLDDLPDSARRGMTFHFVEKVEEVVPVALAGSKQGRGKKTVERLRPNAVKKSRKRASAARRLSAKKSARKR